jgi:3-hydroxyisobutyrate dehydrogenase
MTAAVPGPAAVLGAGGIMGFAMARNMARAGVDVRAWNRSREKAEPLAGDGATIAATPAEAARGAEVVVTILSDADAVVEAVEPALAEAGERTVWAQMSTIGIDGTERCAALADRHGVMFVDAPVLGTKAPAERGELIVMASGPAEVRDRVEPLLHPIAKKILWVGEAGAGTRLKLVTNAWILTVVEGAAETIALAEGIGVDPQQFLEVLSGGPLDLPYLQMKGKAIIEREFEPSFRLALAAKDAALVEDAAARHSLDLPIVATVRARMEEGIHDHGDEDMSATYWTSAPR